MADLSEAYNRTLLGENYKEVLAQAQKEGRAQTSAGQLWTEQIEKCGSRKFSAFAVMVVGGLWAVSNFYAVSGPSVVLVGLFGVLLFLEGTAGTYTFR